MHIKKSLLRVAAAATVTAFLTVGGGASAQAAMVAADRGQAAEQGAKQSAAGQKKADEQQAAAADKPAQGTQNRPEQSKGTEAAGSAGDASGTDESRPAPTPSQGDKAQGPKSTDKAKGPKATDRPSTSKASGNAADRSSNGNGHTPVTVCHALGNGGFIEITFDENALEKHLDNHGDLYPVPAAGCPAPVESMETATENGRATVCHLLGNGSYNLLTFDDSALPAHVAHGDHVATDEADCETTVAGVTLNEPTDREQTSASAADQVVEKFQVLGVQAERSAAPEVLGAEANLNRAPAAVASVAGILPATGAGDYALALLGGVGLLAAGAALLSRRKVRSDS